MCNKVAVRAIKPANIVKSERNSKYRFRPNFGTSLFLLFRVGLQHGAYVDIRIQTFFQCLLNRLGFYAVDPLQLDFFVQAVQVGAGVVGLHHHRQPKFVAFQVLFVGPLAGLLDFVQIGFGRPFLDQQFDLFEDGLCKFVRPLRGASEEHQESGFRPGIAFQFDLNARRIDAAHFFADFFQ